MHRNHQHDVRTGAGGLGHNHAHAPLRAAQWQTPHLDQAANDGNAQGAAADLDLVETAFVEGFVAASDATSFLRLANVPFELTSTDGTRLRLLRIEVETVADVASVTPHLGGTSFRYEPLPGSLVSRRRRLRFVFFDGTALRPLSFADVRALQH